MLFLLQTNLRTQLMRKRPFEISRIFFHARHRGARREKRGEDIGSNIKLILCAATDGLCSYHGGFPYILSLLSCRWTFRNCPDIPYEELMGAWTSLLPALPAWQLRTLRLRVRELYIITLFVLASYLITHTYRDPNYSIGYQCTLSLSGWSIRDVGVDSNASCQCK